MRILPLSVIVALLAASPSRAQPTTQGTEFAPLPAAPDGFEVRQLVATPEMCTRLASDGAGDSLLVLAQSGNVYRIDLHTNQIEPILKQAEYAPAGGGDFIGMCLDRDGRLYVVGNHGI